jgi:hypothetical protein
VLPKLLDAAERFSGDRPSDERMARLVDDRGMAPLFV